MPRSSGNSSPDRLYFERCAWRAGHHRVAGVDEVGRGPLAGPVVAAAVILPETAYDLPLADSKVLTASVRTELAARLRALDGIAVGIGVLDSAAVDRLNILRASQAAMRAAVSELRRLPTLALVDGLPVPDFPVPARFLVRGDARSASIAAASILAKVYRDALMVELDARHPGYGFARHKGYATAAHLAALEQLGPSPVHRRSFAPVARLLRLETQPEFVFDDAVSATPVAAARAES